MNNLESIDKYLVSEIDEMENAPSDQVWNSIDNKLQANKAARNMRARNFKLLSAAAVLTVATALVIAYTGTTEQKQTTPATVVENINASSSKENINSAIGAQSSSLAAQKENAISLKNTTSLNKSESTDVASHKTTTESEVKNTPAINDKQESLVKNEVAMSATNESKKDNSDKDIILLPYFASGYAGTNPTQVNKATPPGPSVNSIKSEQAETPKTEPKENTVYMPNAFTPNGDGLNDVFLPQTAETPSEYKLSVFDRAGNLVFVSDDIQKGWDGHTNHNGIEEVKEDVYIWRIEMKTVKGEKRHLMGSVTLLK